MRPIPFLFVTLYKLILHEKPRFHIPHAPVVRIVPFVLYPARTGLLGHTPLPFASSLPSREITSLHQDREGMIWIGTTHGVARYDGYETIVFKSDPLHPDLLTDNSITLITDTEHRVFIGTQNGLNLFDKQTWKWMPVLNGAFCHTEIKYVYTDKKQQLWIATAQALYRCDEQLHILRRYDLKAAVTSIYEDHAQHLWILTWGKGLFRWDAEKDHFTGYPAIGNANIPFVLFQDRDEHYWLGTWGDGLFRFYPERNGADMYEHQDVADDIFFDIEQDGHNGQLWMLSYNALHIFNRPTDGILHSRPHLSLSTATGCFPLY